MACCAHILVRDQYLHLLVSRFSISSSPPMSCHLVHVQRSQAHKLPKNTYSCSPWASPGISNILFIGVIRDFLFSWGLQWMRGAFVKMCRCARNSLSRLCINKLKKIQILINYKECQNLIMLTDSIFTFIQFLFPSHYFYFYNCN